MPPRVLAFPDLVTDAPPVPSDGQRAAIEAGAEPTLVLAGPGAGKTFCLIERIRHLIEALGFAPERLCAFTFTNKAAGEIETRLARTLDGRAARVKTGTIHAFCAELLREFGSRIGLEPGFGIADERYQRAVLQRLGQPPRWHGSLLSRFTAHRFRDEPFRHANDADVYEKYQHFLTLRRVLDFDTLLLRTAELLADRHVVARVRARWDCVLVDEFQDLNPVQYAVIRDLAREHEHIFAVGDDEQSIYSWAGADPRVFVHYVNDFDLTAPIYLRENRRCPREIAALARRLISRNPPIFGDHKALEPGRDTAACVRALRFPTEDAELAWVVDDLVRDRGAAGAGLRWGEYALLYRTHRIGDSAEAALLAAGLPCRLAQGRALSEDPVAGYVIAALDAIACPDDIHQERFLEVVLPESLLDDARAKASERRRTLLEQLDDSRRTLPRDHGDCKKLNRAFYALANLQALGARHPSLAGLVAELLSHRVGEYRTVLEEHHDDLTDPASHDEVVRLAARLRAAVQERRALRVPRLGGAEIGIKGMLAEIGVRVLLGPAAGENDASDAIEREEAPALGLPLALFKAAQLMRCGGFTNAFRDFTAVDLETTDKDLHHAEIVEIAAVRVRDGVPVGEYHSLIRPRVPIAPGAARAHGISAAEVAGAPYFEAVWPAFRGFCGSDLLVAHNGYQFDFPILERMSGEQLSKYDTLPLARDLHPGSAKLGDLAHHFGIDTGTQHRALDDARTLARVFLALGEAKVARSRKTALVNLLDHLGIALALCDDDGLDREGLLLRRLCRPYALGRYSDCLERYREERELADDNALPTVAQLIERLGGEQAMQRIRAVRSADQRYPVAMARLRRLLGDCTDGSLKEQIGRFLECVALSRSDGVDPERERINLLTLHSTKGLEFSRVYILGVEDAQLPGSSPTRSASTAEIEEARRLLYVGMTRAKDRLVLTCVDARNGHPTGGQRFLNEMEIQPERVQ
ncbi:MAG TPA: UvrD-helicase domain-containing protein [Gemmatimonadaceae bacterium]|nr:UvrD-helicase domain-containing protein [Gemmatimonadaceae bacterium]